MVTRNSSRISGSSQRPDHDGGVFGGELLDRVADFLEFADGQQKPLKLIFT
jgi:hypothetical protein